MRFSKFFVGGIVATLLFAVTRPLPAQDSSRGYDPLAAGQDAYEYHEQMRLDNINRQLGLIDQMKWYSALPAIHGASGTSWYGNSGVGSYYRDPPSLDYLYATGRRSAYGYGAWGRGLTPLYGGGYSRDIFSPWPSVPGDIYGYQWYDPVPQSIGQRQIQTGPNRWESHPVYAPRPDVERAATPPPAGRAPVSPEDPFGEAPRRRPREF